MPANPVSELLQFLQGEVQWQWDPLKTEQLKTKSLNTVDGVNSNSNEQSALAAQVQRYLPKLIEQWLVTRHPALPFAQEVFVQSETNSVHSNSLMSIEDDGNALIDLLARAMQKEKLYQQSTNAPARVWHEVFERLHAQNDDISASVKVHLPSKEDYAHIAQRILLEGLSDVENVNNNAVPKLPERFDISQVDMQKLYYQVRHPAKHFLREQQVHIVLPEDEMAHQEPLSLSGLSAYQVNTQLLDELNKDVNVDNTSARNLLYDPVMPAGVARQSTLQYQQLKLQQQCQEFAEQLAALGIDTCVNNRENININDDAFDERSRNASTLLTPCAETMITVASPDINPQGQLQIKGVVPVAANMANQNSDTSSPESSIPDVWLNILPNSARTQYLLQFWLAHVFWQVARHTTEAQVTAGDGRSIWRFNKGSPEYKKFKDKTTFELAPIAYDTALAELLKWIRFANIAGTTPMAVLPVYAVAYLDKVNEAKAKDTDYHPKRSDFESWLWPDYNSDVIYDSCSQHELWQYILDKQDAFAKLKDALPALAKPLFGAMDEALKAL